MFYIKKILSASMVLSLIFNSYTLAAPARNQSHNLIQDQLFIYEYTRDLDRTQQQLLSKQTEILHAKKTLEQAETAFAKEKQRMGDFLRSVYVQDQPSVLFIFFNVHSLKKMFVMLDFFHVITEQNKMIISTYQNEKENVKKQAIVLQKEQEELLHLQQKYQNHLNEINLRSQKYSPHDIRSAKSVVDTLLFNWTSIGLPTFSQLFAELSQTISNLPKLVRNEDITSRGFFSKQLSLRETDLNAYLSQNNDLFKTITFSFQNNLVIVKGDYHGQTLQMEGAYQIKDSYVSFEIERLVFNQIELPPVTIQDMEEQYELGFYPNKIMKGIVVKSISSLNGKLTFVVSL